MVQKMPFLAYIIFLFLYGALMFVAKNFIVIVSKIFLRLLTHCASALLLNRARLLSAHKAFYNSVFIAFSCSNEGGKVYFAYF